MNKTTEELKQAFDDFNNTCLKKFNNFHKFPIEDKFAVYDRAVKVIDSIKVKMKVEAPAVTKSKKVDLSGKK